MVTDRDTLEAEKANERFYQALNESNLDRMEEIWSHTMAARCIHPGWDILIGWTAIRESWQSIFSAGGDLSVEAAEVEVNIVGEVAWVQCLEQIRNTGDAGDQLSVARATNLFVRDDGGWRMVLHHASPIPSPMEEDDLGLVH
jgi:ketosteroid isomerase-like protein